MKHSILFKSFLTAMMMATVLPIQAHQMAGKNNDDELYIYKVEQLWKHNVSQILTTADVRQGFGMNGKFFILSFFNSLKRNTSDGIDKPVIDNENNKWNTPSTI